MANLLEASIVIGRRGAATDGDLDLFIEDGAVELMPVTPEQVDFARRAWRRFGKGNHWAALNFGDCSETVLSVLSGSS